MCSCLESGTNGSYCVSWDGCLNLKDKKNKGNRCMIKLVRRSVAFIVSMI